MQLLDLKSVILDMYWKLCQASMMEIFCENKYLSLSLTMFEKSITIEN